MAAVGSQVPLKFFYERFFPGELFYNWLSYFGTEEFEKRELCFTIGEIFARYQAFSSKEDMMRAIIHKIPSKIDIGPIYNTSPHNRNAVHDFHPCSREFVFDIDMDDYDAVRTCCEGAKLCHRCWQFLAGAVEVLSSSLREDFGFNHFFWVFSGRRGVHCWVCDKRARDLTDRQRQAIVGFLTVATKDAQRPVNVGTYLHPSIEKSYNVLRGYFIDHIVAETGQDIMGDEHISKLLPLIHDREIVELIQAELVGSHLENSARWAKLEKILEKENMQEAIQQIVLHFTYPRLDEHVSTKRNHLLKAPFVIHPKTGNICVPFAPEEAADFDPLDVPTIDKIDAEMTKNQGNIGETTYGKYLAFFNDFLQKLKKDEIDPAQRAKRRARGDEENIKDLIY